ncbi:MAG: hypothetical protein AB2814_03115 [Candidatus Sedimenticola endophacoides]
MRGVSLVALLAAAGVRAETSPAAGEGLGGWEVAAIVFALGMVLSLFHSVSLLRNSARPGPAYWLGRASSACAKSDARAAEQALLLWARTVWGDAAPSSLLEIAARLEREEMAQLLRQLREAARDGTAQWSGYLCREVLIGHLRELSAEGARRDG